MKYVYRIRDDAEQYHYIVAGTVTEAVAYFDKLMRPKMPDKIEQLGVAHLAPDEILVDSFT